MLRAGVMTESKFGVLAWPADRAKA
jgi:hypothetical protein